MNRILIAIIFLGVFQITAFAQELPQGIADCPVIRATISPETAYIGEIFTAIADVQISSTSHIKYHWIVWGGEIVSGQGTPEIRVKQTLKNIKDTLALAVEVTGFPVGCTNFATASAEPIEKTTARIIDKYGILGRLGKERLDNFAIEIQNDPTAQGLLAVSVDKQTNKQAKLYLSRVYHYLVNQRGMEAARLSFVVAKKEGEESIELYIVPAGATMPTFPEKHQFVTGADLTPKTAPKPKPKPKRRKRR